MEESFRTSTRPHTRQYTSTAYYLKLTHPTALSETNRLILEYVRKAKKSQKKTVWLSEAIEALQLDPREAVNSAKKLEEYGLLKPKRQA